MSDKKKPDPKKIVYREGEDDLSLALFRLLVLAPLIKQETYERGEKSSLIADIIEQEHYLPSKGSIKVSERNLFRWQKLFREGGVDALRPHIRVDSGTLRFMSQELIARCIELRKEIPERSTKTLMDIISRENKIAFDKFPHESTFNRHLLKHGCSRRQLKILGKKRTIKMEFENFGDLWVGDFKHGLMTLAPNGKLKKAKLSAFIDHHTRYPIADRWYLDEKIDSLRDCLYRIFLTWGIAGVIYVDRGSVYRSNQLKYSLARLNIKLIHSKPYYSQGRGVIEKWWQVVDSFLHEVRARKNPLTIHELNQYWQAYKELRYCDEIHSEIGKTPNEAIKNVEKKPIDPDVARELFLIGEKRKVNHKTSCVSVENHSFLCESYLRGQWVIVRYDPNDLSSVLIFKQQKRIQRAFPRPINEIPEPEPTHNDIIQSVDYLALLREDYERRLVEDLRPVTYTDLIDEPNFGVQEFIDCVCDLAGLHREESIERELRLFWDTYGSIPEKLTRAGTEQAVRLQGRGRHIRVYINIIRTLVLAYMKSTD